MGSFKSWVHFLAFLSMLVLILFGYGVILFFGVVVVLEALSLYGVV